jgi:hypothetical protein
MNMGLELIAKCLFKIMCDLENKLETIQIWSYEGM